MWTEIFKIIFGRRPFVYAIIYLLLIPTFALIFTLLPYQFYHSTAKFEYSILNPKADSILGGIERQVLDNLKKNKSIDTSLDIESISLSSLKYEEGKYYFKLCYGELIKLPTSDSNYGYSRGCYDISFLRKPFMIIYDENGKPKEYLHEVFRETPRGVLDTVYFKDRLRQIFFSEKIYYPILATNKRLDDELGDFARTLYGFPASFGDNFWRMTYLSTVTITTLGFGDIVPLSNKARILISLEAIMGVIIIGLFLNAIAKRN